MNAKTNFYGIEEHPPTRRRGVERWVRPGDARRAYGWLKASEYQRLLDRERREPLVAFYCILTAIVCAFGLVYLMG